MLDVFHYLLDEDMSFVNGEHAQSKSIIRESLYKNLYDTKYKYGYNERDSSFGYDSEDEDSLVMSGNATSNEIKPYMPPTPFNPDAPNPFGSALREKPLG